jgi:hypothetical protein
MVVNFFDLTSVFSLCVEFLMVDFLSSTTRTGGGSQMKQLSKVVLALSFILFTSSAYAEMAKEGSGSYRGAKSGTLKILTFEKGHIHANFDEAGVIVEAPEDSPFFNASFHSLGTFTSNQGATEGSGGIKFTRPNGDTFYGTFNFGGKYQRGPTSGIVKIIGGTGECSGMQGEIELLPRPKVTTSTGAGSYQNMAIANISWKIP